MAKSLSELKAQFSSGYVISITYDENTGILTVVGPEGSATYKTHQEIPTYEIKLEGNDLFVNRESVGKVTIDASKVTVQEGVLYIDGQPTDIKVSDSSKVEVIDEILHIDGVATKITVPSASSVVEVIDEILYIDGAAQEIKTEASKVEIIDGVLHIDGIATELAVTPDIRLENGTLYVGGQEQKLVAPEDLEGFLTQEDFDNLLTKNALAFVTDTDGNVTGVTIRIDDQEAIFKVYQVGYVTSLTFIPRNIDAQLGRVAFFPVIAYDRYSNNAHPCFEYNESKDLWETLYPGWVTMSYRVNPSNVSRDSYEIIGFDNEKAYVMGRSIANNITMKDWMNNDILNIKIQGLSMMNCENAYDDPKGTPQTTEYDNIDEVDQLALQIKNIHATETAINNGIVTSEYIPVKRMVIEQQDIRIGLNTDINLENDLEKGSFRNLADMYPVNGHTFNSTASGVVSNIVAQSNSNYSTDVNEYKKSLAVHLYVPFSGTTNLEEYLENYADFFHTNTGYDSDQAQYLLASLGFDEEEFERVYEIEGYQVGQVDQSTGADIYDSAAVM